MHPPATAVERDFADFFDNGAMPLHWVDAHGVIVRANRAELELLGYERDEYVGRNVAEFHADPGTIADILRRLQSRETLRNYPARLRHKNGSLRDVLITSNVQWGDEGVFVHTRCFTVDVTDAKRVEEERSRTADYLEGLMEGFVAYDGDWVMTYMNAAAERLLGRRRDEVLGKRWHEAFPHAVGNPVDHMYQRVMRSRSAERMEYCYEHYRRWMEIAASPVRTGGVAVYFRDISDRMRAITELKRAGDELREADRRKDEFLAVLAHELRNPLAPIRNGLHVLAVSPFGEAAEQARAMMDRQTRHLVRLVDDLLEVSRIRTGTLELRRESAELSGLVDHAVEASRPLIEAAGHRLQVELPGEALYLDVDPVRISQVLTNLLNNAAKYTPPGGSIRLSALREAEQAVIRVRDNGIGLDGATLPRLFERFARFGDSARAQGGLGIGLSLSRHLVELHGGSLEAASEGRGKGSEFTVRLPLVRTSSPRASPEKRAPSAA